MEVAPFFVDFHHFLSIFTIFYRFSRFTHFCRDLHFVAIYALFPQFFFGQNSLLRNITRFLHVWQYVKVKAQDRKLCASPFDFLPIVKLSWFHLFPFCTVQSKHCVVVPCTVVFTLWKDHAHRVGTLWTHRGGHKEGLFAQSR